MAERRKKEREGILKSKERPSRLPSVQAKKSRRVFKMETYYARSLEDSSPSGLWTEITEKNQQPADGTDRLDE